MFYIILKTIIIFIKWRNTSAPGTPFDHVHLPEVRHQSSTLDPEAPRTRHILYDVTSGVRDRPRWV